MGQRCIPDEVLSVRDIKLFIKGIKDADKQYKQYCKDRNLATENGRDKTIWDNIFTNVRDDFSREPFQNYTIARGRLWEFVAVYRTDIKILYIIMKEDRFKEIKGDKKSAYHYSRILNSKNNHFQDVKCEQTTLFEQDVDSPTAEYISDDLERMIGSIKDEVVGCVNILFKVNDQGVSKITGNIATYELDIIKTYNWSKYIEASIDDIADTSNDDMKNQPEIKLTLKSSKQKSSANSIVDEKKEKQKKKEEN
jgi:hypothetical protein